MKNEAPSLRGDFSADSRLILLSVLAVGIGAAGALVADVLLKMIAFFTNIFFFQTLSTAPTSPANNHLGLWVIFVPALGGLIIGLMARFGTEKIRGHGIPEALEAILFSGSVMQFKVAVLKPISSALSIGSGGPFGAEGPIIMTGGAFGSLFAQAFKMSSAERKTLLVAGAASGMSIIFASPVAAVLLAVELLLFEWRPRSTIPVAFASGTAAFLRPYFLGEGPLFPIPDHVPSSTSDLFIALAVGLGTGLLACLLSVSLYKVEDFFHRLPIHWMWWPAMGGLVVGLGGYFQPRALGVGYDVINDLLLNHIALGAVCVFVLVKAGIWIVSLASGTSGGVLAPLLMMGASLGSVVQAIVPAESHAPWALVAMAASLGGMMRAPFTAMIFAIELTRDINAINALLIASVTAYAVTVLLLKRSILTEKVARRGYDIFREYSVDPLERLRLAEIMSKKVVSIGENLTVSEVKNKFFLAPNKHQGYPVTDDFGALVGVISMSDLLNVKEGEATLVKDRMRKPPIVGYLAESCRSAAEKMAQNGIGRLPVIDSAGKIVGIVTRSDLLKPRLADSKEERVRERLLRMNMGRNS